jgi:hypothetical protein
MKNVMSRLYKDPDVEFLRGNTVNEKGELGWADFRTGKKYIPLFDDVITAYKTKVNPLIKYARGLLQGVIYKHEDFEQKYKGSIGHEEMEVENLFSTKDRDIHLAEVAMHDLGIKHGRKFSKRIAEMTDITSLIENYRLDDKYLRIREGIADILGIDPEPAYAHAPIGGD